MPTKQYFVRLYQQQLIRYILHPSISVCVSLVVFIHVNLSKHSYVYVCIRTEQYVVIILKQKLIRDVLLPHIRAQIIWQTHTSKLLEAPGNYSEANCPSAMNYWAMVSLAKLRKVM